MNAKKDKYILLITLFLSFSLQGCSEEIGDIAYTSDGGARLLSWAEETEQARVLFQSEDMARYEAFKKSITSSDPNKRAELTLLFASIGDLTFAKELAQNIDIEDLDKTRSIRALFKAHLLFAGDEPNCELDKAVISRRAIPIEEKFYAYSRLISKCPPQQNTKEMAQLLCKVANPKTDYTYLLPFLYDGVERLLASATKEELLSLLAGREIASRDCLPSSKFLLRALISRKLKEHNEAVEYAMKSLISDPAFSSALITAVEEASKADKFDSEQFVRITKVSATSLTSKDSELAIKLATTIKSKLGKPAEAENILKDFLQRAKDPLVKERTEEAIAGLLAENERFDDLFSLIEKRGEEKRYKHTDNLCGVTMFSTRDLKLLEEALSKRMAQKTFTPPLISLKARICESRGDKRCAADNWVAAANQWPLYEPWLDRALQWLGRFNMEDDAIVILEKRVAANPMSKQNRVDLIKLLKATNEKDLLTQYYKRWESEVGTEPDRCDWLAEVYLKADNARKAKRLLDTALKANPKRARYRLHNAMAELALGDCQGAMADAEAIIVFGESHKPIYVRDSVQVYQEACDKMMALSEDNSNSEQEPTPVTEHSKQKESSKKEKPKEVLPCKYRLYSLSESNLLSEEVKTELKDALSQRR